MHIQMYNISICINYPRPVGELLLCLWQSAANWHSANQIPASTGECCSGDCEGRHLDQHGNETNQGPGVS